MRGASGRTRCPTASGRRPGDDDATPVGTMCIIDLPDRAAAEAYAAGDGYAKAGLLEAPEIIRFVNSKRLRQPDRAHPLRCLCIDTLPEARSARLRA